jgi:hypothetical protein
VVNKVVLDITAEQGGGLLGDLLCTIADLLDGGGQLRRLARLLNQLLGALGAWVRPQVRCGGRFSHGY